MDSLAYATITTATIVGGAVLFAVVLALWVHHGLPGAALIAATGRPQLRD